MAHTHDIAEVRTGNGFDGKRVAIIIAADEAGPGSLTTLTRFLQEQGYDARPGYTGRQKNHVLRLQGIPSDATLEHALKVGFPQWQREQGSLSPISPIPHDLPFIPMRSPPAKEGNRLTGMLKSYSTEMTAVSYLAGNLGLVFSALYGKNQGKNIEWLKLAAPACYTMASAMLFLLNSSRPKSRDMARIWDEISPQLLRDDANLTNAERQQLHKHGRAIVRHAWEFMKQHPWEISGLLNMAGASAHFGSALRNSNRTEAVAALSTLTAMGIITFAPKNGKEGAILPSEAYQPLTDKLADELTAPFGEREKKQGTLHSFFSAGQKALDWIQENPLRAASAIQITANSGYGIAALTKRDASGHRKIDKGLLASSGTYLAGNAFQSLANKTSGPSLDDVVDTVCTALRSQADKQLLNPEKLNAHIAKAAEILAEQPEIRHSKPALDAGIRMRLQNGDKASTSPLNGFIALEKSSLKDSPFISPHMLRSESAGGIRL